MMNDVNPSRSEAITGLSQSEADARLAAEGFNELPDPAKRKPLHIVVEVLSEPMFALLIGGGAIYLLLGDLKEALILLVFALMSIVITVVQEIRTERVLEALRDLTTPRALVIRDRERRHVAGRDVVRGDAIVIAEGDRVPADAVLLQGRDLQTDESLLTGESIPVRKVPSDRPLSAAGRPGGDDSPFIYSGSLVVRGSGIAEVVATGVRSEVGKIGQLLHVLETEPPRLQKQTRKLVRVAALGGGAVSVLVMVLYGLFRGGWLQAVLAGITIGISMLPEEIPVVLTVFMAMGAWRISQARVLTRRAAAIETLGSATVLCTDKTGTLTENRMSIAELRGAGGVCRIGEGVRPDGALQGLVQYGVLASAPEPFDPMEKAFHALARDVFATGEPTDFDALRLVKSYELRPECLAMTQVWQMEGRKDALIVATKGAPEAVAELCRLSPAERADMAASIDAMAGEGLRVLGIASAEYRKAEPDGALPETPAEYRFTFLGLVGFADPLRPTVPAAVAQCRSAGVRVVMITGDYPVTALAIARQAGLDANEVLTGDMLERLDDPQLAARVRTATVFARILPEQKLRIVQALKSDGEIVAMTGDGVNDAPSLKAAHIGVAMGQRGTDVAREASSIVLLDDDFGSIVASIRLGRRIYDNLRKAMNFIVAVHVPIAGLALLPLLLGLPIIFGPVHIAFLEMVIDPVCSLVFEAEREEDDAMRRPPRSPSAPLLSWQLIAWGVLQGVLAFVVVAAMFAIALKRGMPENEMRALAFFALVLGIISLILVNRSFTSSLMAALGRPNPALLWILPIIATVLGFSLAVPQVSDLFRFGPLHADDLALTAAAGIVLLLLLEALKLMWRKWLRT